MQQTSLEFLTDDALAGFRLHRFEVFNWGTFDGSVWVLSLDGENGLLTGDIGSGKSTLVDGLTTLFVPTHRIVFNKAAGAEGKERSLASYVRGYYKSEKDDMALSAKAVALREKNTYSVLLAHFHNAGLAQGVTLAQVFWLQDNQQNPERFYLVADGDLSIATDFSGFGTDIRDLKRELKKRGALLFDEYVHYASEFRRRFGLQNEQALNLFYQTVSMKSVGNLTDFIRQHMLEAPPVQQKLEEIRRDFDNVNLAYEAVMRAKAQIGMLTPMVADCDRLEAQEREYRSLVDCREALHAYFAEQKAGLLDERIAWQERELARLNDRLAEHKEALDRLDRHRSDLRRSIDDNGGRRLEDIRLAVERLDAERSRLAKAASEYHEACDSLGLPFPGTVDTFHRLREEIRALQEALEAELRALDEAIFAARKERDSLHEAHAELSDEVTSLRSRPSNIPLDFVRLRERLCAELGISEDDVPYAGELIRVAEEASEWEGAAERLVRSFGLSLLVPDALYARVARYVDRTHLKGRLVYYRVPIAPGRISWPQDPRSLVHKLRLKQDSPFLPWLESEVARRFDMPCVEDLDEFGRLPAAITAQGQVKTRGDRHEKDDRHRIDDRSRYVLGWTTHEKLRALEDRLRQMEHRGHEVLTRLEGLGRRQTEARDRRDGLRDLARVQEYREIHWEPVAEQIQALLDERRRIEAGADLLRQLQDQLQEAEKAYRELLDQEREAHGKCVRLETLLEQNRAALQEARGVAASLTDEQKRVTFPRLASYQAETLGDKRLTVENCNSSQTEVREALKAPIDAAVKTINRLRDAVIGQMKDYKHRFVQETLEVDARLESATEFRSMLAKLNEEDLPRHEERFKALLNERTIQGIAMFQNWLDKARRDIEEKIATINQSLRDIEYNPGTYIQLVADRTQEADVRDFQKELRDCLGGTLSGEADELYAEAKFRQVKQLIDRFNGREGMTELDRRWTQKVTDVRNWFMFSASERWETDGTEKEYYSDSGGKSGGQKEKLAYTVLASALAYQFGLEPGVARSRSFRFVMIDEAFGRGSDESARYGLELFKKLSLQLLVVTPLQKIHVIEDYVKSVHFVHNREGRNSQVQTLTIEAYHERKAAASAS